RVAFVGERLDDDLTRTDFVEAAVEAELVVPPDVPVTVGATGAAVIVVDSHLQAARTVPPGQEVRVGVRAEDLLRWCVKVPGNSDERNLWVHVDAGLVDLGGHDDDPF